MIRNFIYLDEDKMYSLSSQLFEGVTEYVLNESFSEKSESEDQKGPVGSGRVLGDILRSGDRRTEKKFLNDYSFSIFEKRLIDDSAVSIVSASASDVDFDGRSFAKVSSRVVFNDINSIKKTLGNFNDVGRAMAHVTNFEEISAADRQLGELRRAGKGGPKLQAELKSLMNVDRIAKNSGLYQDKKFLDDLALLLEYGFQDQLEIQMNVGENIFSSNLNRLFLRESEDLLVRKYSRRTEVEFTLFGIVTQYKGGAGASEGAVGVDGIKGALMNLISSLIGVESTFTGRLENEIIVDPIAIYVEL
ncbi:DUF6414 family protein [Stenotrophomonas maltophilia]|uniref:DUF6414 family protein n=2 Tax=Stenotrophomonas TaxID=40323 RepID=UPI0032D3CB05